jgi:hypothetical protein
MNKMVVVILRPDNFLDPLHKFSRIVRAETGPELMEKAMQAYGFQNHPPDIQIYIYSSPPGCTNRVRLDLEAGPFDERWPLTVWVFIHKRGL